MKSFDVCFISCVKEKQKKPCPAIEIYKSSLFIKSLAFANQFKRPIYILSAKHHLIKGAQIVEPYDLTLNSFTKSELTEWSNVVANQINSQFPNKTILVLAGEKYLGFASLVSNDIVNPLKGLPIGKRLAWLKANTKK
jgi:hypothetical protein